MAKAAPLLVAIAAAAAVAALDTAAPPNAEGCGGECPADHVLMQRGHHHSRAKRAQPAEDHAPGTSGTLLEAGSAAAEAAATMRKPNAAEKQAFLDEHNTYRCMHGAPPVTWSDAVADKAVEYVSPMTNMKHAKSYNIPPPAGPAGENIYWSSNAGTAKGAVDAWYSEVNDCNGGPTGFTDGCANGRRPTGHFTAMIWKGVKQIGCGFSDSRTPTVILCRYKAGDSLSNDTPNMNKGAGNYKNQVFTRKKSAEQCGGSSAPAAPSSSGSHGQAKTCTSRDTGGTCGWFSCNKSRDSRCVDGKCVCTGGKCAVGGKCVHT